MTTADVLVTGTVEQVRTIAVTGEVDLANVAIVEDRILDATSNDLLGLVLDLTGVDYLDSTGLKLLFTLAVRLEISQITLELVVAAGSAVQRVLEMTGVGDAVPMRTAG